MKYSEFKKLVKEEIYKYKKSILPEEEIGSEVKNLWDTDEVEEDLHPEKEKFEKRHKKFKKDWGKKMTKEELQDTCPECGEEGVDVIEGSHGPIYNCVNCGTFGAIRSSNI